MQHLLNALPIWFALLLFAVVPAAIAVVLHDIFRRIVPSEALIPHHDVAGFLVSIVGLMFAVVLAFLVAAAWGAFDTAQRTADSEASDVAETFASAAILPEPARSRVRSLMADYAFEVRDREWEMLSEDRQDFRAREFVERAFATVALSAEPKNAGIGEAMQRSSAMQIVVTNLETLTTDRRRRLIDATRHIPDALYLALVMAWVLLMAFVFLFGCTRALQLTMTALVTATIGLLFGVIVEFDYPYSHGIRVSSDAWTQIIENNHLDGWRRTPPAAITP